jgi:penicillin-binding protein 1A
MQSPFVKKFPALLKQFFLLSYLNFIRNRYLRLLAGVGMYVSYYIAAVHLNFLWLFGYMPSLKDVKHPEVAMASEVYTADSVLIGRFYNENRTPVAFDQISHATINALVATEDIRFYKHHGLDLFALAGGIYSTAKGDERGASTITQQLAKNMYQTRRRINQGLLQHIPIINTLISKSKEWMLAVKLELFYSKNEILEMYLNTVDFGNNWFGVKVASQNYFDKTPAFLNIQESATLIGLLKATTSYNPLTNKKRALVRRNVVLAQMLKYNFITQAEFDSISFLPLIINRPVNNPDSKDSYIRQAVERQLKNWCSKNGANLYEDGLRIYTTINSRLQSCAEQAVWEHMRKVQKQFYEHWGGRNPWVDENGMELKNFAEINCTKTPIYQQLTRQFNGNSDSVKTAMNAKKPMRIFTYAGPKDTLLSSMDSLRYYARILNAGLMSIEPTTGAVKAYVGGINHDYFKFDRVVQSKRQAGSTFKPFAYLAALEDTFSPCSRMVDEPVKIEYDNGQVWEPKNSNGTFTYASKTLRRALAQSVNSITAQLTQDVGWENVVAWAHRLGIRSRLDTVPSICLGSSDVNVFEMVSAYSTFANKGIHIEPQLVKRIMSHDHILIEEFTVTRERIISEENAWLMLYMLQGSIQEPGGTSQALWGYNIFSNNNEIAGKTGTTSNYSDAWYMGITHDLVTGVWVGADYRSVHFRGAAGQGSRLALPIFAKMLEKAYKNSATGLTPGKFQKPSGKISKTFLCNSDDLFPEDFDLPADSSFWETDTISLPIDSATIKIIHSND